ncbi:MAG: STAS domain-containing protein [Pseudomonadota bacterium]
MSGRILVGDHNGVYIIRFEGDVRVTLSGSFDHYLESILRDADLVSVLVDLSDAKAIDSTSLGVLAKLSIAVQQQREKLPTLVCGKPDILRILHNMGFDDIFAIVDEVYQSAQNLAELPVATDLDEESLRRQVIEAHTTLMEMNQRNHDTFKDLVGALEAEDRAQQIKTAHNGC